MSVAKICTAPGRRSPSCASVISIARLYARRADVGVAEITQQDRAQLVRREQLVHGDAGAHHVELPRRGGPRGEGEATAGPDRFDAEHGVRAPRGEQDGDGTVPEVVRE